MFQTKVIEIIETHFMFHNFFFFENHAFYEIMWKRMLERGSPQITIWHIRVACWIPEATTTHVVCVIFITFPLQQWLNERALLRYT